MRMFPSFQLLKHSLKAVSGGVWFVSSGAKMDLENEHFKRRMKICSFCPKELFDWNGIGGSLFTLFASLTYAYHYLMTLIK